jgi:signal peptidase I
VPISLTGCILALLSAALLSGCATAHRVAMAAAATQYAIKHPGGAYRVAYIPSASMLPTLHIGDTVLIDTDEYRHSAPRRGDIVLFKPPMPSVDDFIKRVIALPGDSFRIIRGAVYVNGKRLREPYISAPADYEMQIQNYRILVRFAPGTPAVPLDNNVADVPPHDRWTSPDRVPANCYIVLGDNRNDSEDSHAFGCVERNHFTGKLVKVL